MLPLSPSPNIVISSSSSLNPHHGVSIRIPPLKCSKRTTEAAAAEAKGSSAAKSSSTSARGRRLLRVREEKRRREYDRAHNYPQWAKILEDACRDDSELRAVLGDSIGDPELMRKKVEQRVRTKGRNFNKSKTGSVLAFKVSFRDFNPIDSFIWFELYGAPSDRDVDLLGSVIQSWYVMGRLGAYNSSNLQMPPQSKPPSSPKHRSSSPLPPPFNSKAQSCRRRLTPKPRARRLPPPIDSSR